MFSLTKSIWPNVSCTSRANRAAFKIINEAAQNEATVIAAEMKKRGMGAIIPEKNISYNKNYRKFNTFIEMAQNIFTRDLKQREAK